MSFFAQLLASAIGGAVVGYFVLLGVHLQFRRQSEAALRTLMVEVTANKEAVAEMNGSLGTTGEFQLGRADPGWLKHGIWDSQLTYVVQLLDDATLIPVRYAYSLLDSVPAMVNEGRSPANPRRFQHGGWINTALVEVERAFSDADRALENLKKRWAQEAEGAWYNRLRKFADDLCRRL